MRHGETIANRDKWASGWQDVDLTDKGRAQAQQCSEIVNRLHPKPSIIIHSSLKRARDTAAIINTNLCIDMVECEGLKEQFFGDWEGKSWTEINKDRERHGLNPPKGESQVEFVERISKNLEICLNDYPPHPLFVLHGGVFQAIGLKFSVVLPSITNCALYSFSVNKVATNFPFTVYKHEIIQGELISTPETFYNDIIKL